MMRRVFLLSMLMAFVICSTAVAHWDGINYKMHFPQLPDTNGWDVCAMYPMVLADDWECSVTGTVTDVHFWGSFLGDIYVPDDHFGRIRLGIWSDSPDPDGSGPLFSHPDVLLVDCTRDLPANWHAVHTQGFQTATLTEGWFCPPAIALPNNHQEYFLYNWTIPKECQFEQEEGNIYWLSISVELVPTGDWGWKTADVDQYPSPYTGQHFNDDAVYSAAPYPPDPASWLELRDPVTLESLDLSFVITGWWPTSIRVASFTATTFDRYVGIDWRTETELENAGFNLYRATSPDGPKTRLNDELIPTKGNELEGASYSYRDFDVDGGDYYYWFEDVSLDGKGYMNGPVRASGAKSAPTDFSLNHYPNPFNPTTEIKYSLPENVDVTLEIYNVRGQLVKTLVNEYQQAGDKVVSWDGTNADGMPVASGSYFCKLQAGGFMEVQKMVLLK
jgi:hypothetical protein